MIADVRDKVVEFLKETIDAKSIRIIRVDKVDGGWIAEAEVAEKSRYLASINPDYKVFEKELYVVKMNNSLDVFSYKRMKQNEEEREGSRYEF